MDSTRFDDLLRAIASGLSRRATLAALASSLFTAGSAAILNEDAEAKKKRKKKKKKKCKGGTKKCGKKCIAATACCSNADCGNGGACVSGACDCLSGFIPCDGACITDEQCCPACTGNRVCQSGDCVCDDGFHECNGDCIPETECCETCSGDLICEGGECVCPADAPFECPGDVCNIGNSCCEDIDCPGTQTCFSGFCLCPELDEITCGDDCCDSSTEVCDAIGTETCEAGNCATHPNDWCNGTDFFECADNGIDFCVCATTADPMTPTVCVDHFSTFEPESCAACSSNADCGAGFACIEGNLLGGTFCGCDNPFCVPLCSEGAPRGAARIAGPALDEAKASKKRGSRRRRRR